MRWKALFVAAVVVGMAAFAYTAVGSPPGAPSATPAPGAAAHGPGMNHPLHRQIAAIFILPEMQSELGLSAAQTADLRRLHRDFVAKSKDTAAQTAVRRRELETLLSADTSRTRTVKALLDKIAELHSQLEYAGFDTATRMKAVLSETQRAKFSAMKPAELHQLMMSRGNLAEMEIAMQGMGAQGEMGDGGTGMHAGLATDAGATRDAAPPDSHTTPNPRHGGAATAPPGPAR